LELLAMLQVRFAVLVDWEELDSFDPEMFEQKTVRPIRLRVVNVLKQWVDKHYYDFDADERLQRRFLRFVDEQVRVTPGMETMAVRLRNQMEKKVLFPAPIDHHLLMSTEPPPPPLLPKGGCSDLLDVEPLEVARQLTLIESHLFKQIQPKECLDQAWNKTHLKRNAPNILNLIERFNQMARWISSEIVNEPKLRLRAKLLRRFIEVAAECDALNSFNIIQEILAALNSDSVYRLKATWKELKPKTLAQWEALQKLLSNEHNYKAIRVRLDESLAKGPVLPYLGVFLSDLTFIEEGNKDKIDVGKGEGQFEKLINFDKRRKIAAVIEKIRECQRSPYNFKPVAEIQEVIQFRLVEAQVMNKDTLYQQSLVVEPRKPPSGGTVRSSS